MLRRDFNKLGLLALLPKSNQESKKVRLYLLDTIGIKSTIVWLDGEVNLDNFFHKEKFRISYFIDILNEINYENKNVLSLILVKKCNQLGYIGIHDEIKNRFSNSKFEKENFRNFKITYLDINYDIIQNKRYELLEANYKELLGN